MSYCNYCKGQYPEAGCKLNKYGKCEWEEEEEENEYIRENSKCEK